MKENAMSDQDLSRIVPCRREADCFFEFSAVMPIYQTSVYDFPDLDVVDDVWEHRRDGYIYDVLARPHDRAGERGCPARAGRGGAGHRLGMASIMTAFATLLQAGDEVCGGAGFVCGTVSLSAKELTRFGMAPRFITDTRPDAVRSALGPGTRALVVETISNPLWNVVDIPALAELCRSR
jgi:O-acetylhomoserine/O-acetylserine sulfhydrylase-like pyridoxal-dependent enzyme